MQDRSYTDLKALIEALAGVSSFTSDEDTKIKNLVNRRASQAYNTSPSWPRYLVVGEERTMTTDTQIVPYTQTPKDNIGEFIRIHRKEPFKNNSAIEYDFFVDANGANVLNIANTEDSSVFVTYKKELSTFDENSTDIPGEFFHYLAHATYADFLRMDGQHGKALTEEKQADSYLDSQLEMIDLRSNNNSINKKFSTYVNRQRR
jgi:hypothetical protein